MSDSRLHEARILIVDDYEPNVIALERLLEVADFTNVVSTTDSSQVVSLCFEEEPDLIVLDLHMPAPDGFEVLAMLAPWIRGSTLGAPSPGGHPTSSASPSTRARSSCAAAT